MMCVIGLSGSMPQIRTLATPLPHDAYVWQRVWNRPVRDAIRILLVQELRQGLRSWLLWVIPVGFMVGLTCALQPSLAKGLLVAKMEAMPEGLRKGGYRGAIEVYPWQSWIGWTIRDQIDRYRNDERKNVQRDADDKPIVWAVEMGGSAAMARVLPAATPSLVMRSMAALVSWGRRSAAGT